MKPFMGQWAARVLVAVCAISLMAPGCASTKNVMNKATFGLIGGSQGPDDQSSEAKAERKAREKEEKQQREAEKRAAKDEERARKAAAKEEQQSEEKPGLMSRMTFGLVGGDRQSEADKQIAADTKAAERAQRRQDEEAREREKRDAKAAKRQQEQEEEARKKKEKLAAKEEKAKEKRAAKSESSQVQAMVSPDESASSAVPAQEQPKEKRTLMSRMTFGLVGGKKSDQAVESEAMGQSETPAASTESTTSTPPTSEEPTKEEKKAAKRAEKEQRDSEQQAKKDAERAEKEQQKQAEAEQAEETSTVTEPKEKRTLMSRMTFGLVGGKKQESSDTSEPSDTANTPTDAAASTEPVEPTLPPEQLAMAAPRDVQYDVQSASALDGEAQKLAKMPFKTTYDLSTKSATGKGQATASRETYSKNGYGITDLGDVRIAVQGMTFDGESRAGGVIISSDERLPAAGKAGAGNSAFIYEYAKGVTAAQFGTVNFTIANSVINIGGKSVPIGQGKKLIVVDGQGNVIGAYSVE